MSDNIKTQTRIHHHFFLEKIEGSFHKYSLSATQEINDEFHEQIA